MEKEFILCAAIWINDGRKHTHQPENIKFGFVICGRRHHNCYQVIKSLIGDVNGYFRSLKIPDNDYERKSYQGFITSLDRYVDRKEGWKIALENNQVQFGLEATDNGEESILISENLY